MSNQEVAAKTDTQSTAINYSEMVRRLFKPMEGVGAMMMHAAIGMAGESAELRTAKGRKNILEECGDLEFYIEGAWQQIPDNYTIQVAMEPMLGELLDCIHIHAGNVLDLAKKVWVYGGAKGMRDREIVIELLCLRATLDVFYEALATTQEEVRQLNMNKLLTGANARYKSGAYSNEEALARADKAGEDAAPQRKFMSDTQK